MLVSYTYRSDEPGTESEDTLGERVAHASKQAAVPEMKTFSFYTVVDLGYIIPKDEPPMETESY